MSFYSRGGKTLQVGIGVGLGANTKLKLKREGKLKVAVLDWKWVCGFQKEGKVRDEAEADEAENCLNWEAGKSWRPRTSKCLTDAHFFILFSAWNDSNKTL